MKQQNLGKSSITGVEPTIHGTTSQLHNNTSDNKPSSVRTNITTWLKCSFFLFILAYCAPDNKQIPMSSGEEIELSQAKRFKINKTSDGYHLMVFNPWQNADEVKFTYYLKPDIKNPQFIGDTTLIPYPVDNVICLSTTHIAFLDAIGKTGTVSAMSGTQYTYNKEIRKRIEKGEMPDVGFDDQLNYELIISLDPDVFFAYGIDSHTLGYYQKLEEMGIPVVFIAEYLEKTPLAKTEWLKFIAPFFDAFDESNEVYQNIETEYMKLSNLTDTIVDKPVVMTGLPFQGTWYITGGATYLARLIQDAGGKYLWNDLTESSVYPMDLENVFIKSRKADFWINTGNAKTKSNIVAMDERFSSFPVYNSSMIYNNNARSNAMGGNDYFESGTVNPHLILKDLTHIFHPEVLPDHQLYYYQKIDE